MPTVTATNTPMTLIQFATPRPTSFLLSSSSQPRGFCFGNGIVGTGLLRILHSGSQPSLTSKKNSRSFGTSFVLFPCGKTNSTSAVIPPRLFNQRTVAICCLFSFLYGFAVLTHSYMLPVYFQAVQGTSAAISGFYCLSLSIPSTLCSLAAGFAVTRFGYHIPFMWLGSLLYVAGSVLIYRLSPDNGPVEWIAYQVVGGLGLGVAIQMTFVAVQVVVPSKDTPTVCSMEIFFRRLGGAIGISVAEALFASHVKENLQRAAISGVDASSVDAVGIRELNALGKALSPALQATLKGVLNDAVSRTLIMPVAATSLAAIASWGMEWRTIPDFEELPGEEDDDIEEMVEMMGAKPGAEA